MLAAWIGGWEVILIVQVVLILMLVRDSSLWSEIKRGSSLWGAIKKGFADFTKASVEVSIQIHPPREGTKEVQWKQFRLWIAQGFGIGRVPVAPGTFGSLVGVAWFALLVAGADLGAYLFASVLGVAFSVWLCGEAEDTLGERDPGSVVLDEIIAIPFCFLPWVVSEWLRHGHELPPVDVFFSGRGWFATLGVLGLFRLFDIWKPWPVRQSQALSGGWGVTVDDVLAGFYTALVSLLFVA